MTAELETPANRAFVPGEAPMTIAGMDIDQDQLDQLVGAMTGKDNLEGTIHLDKNGNLPPGMAGMIAQRDRHRKANQTTTEMLLGDQGGMRRVLAGITGVPATIEEPIPRQKSRVEKTAEVVKSISKSNVAAEPGKFSQIAGKVPQGTKVGGAVASTKEAVDKVTDSAQAVFKPDPTRLVGMTADMFTKDDHGQRHLGGKTTKLGLYAIWSLVPFPWNIVVLLVLYIAIMVVLSGMGLVLGMFLSLNNQSPADAVAPHPVAYHDRHYAARLGHVGKESEEDAAQREQLAEEMHTALEEEGIDLNRCLAPYTDRVTHTPAKYIGGQAPEEPTRPVPPTRPGADATADEVTAYNAAVREYNEAVKTYTEELNEYKEVAHLYTTDDPVMNQGTPVLNDGELTRQASAVTGDVPPDADPLLAQAYLMTAWAGGTSGWDHFTTVVRAKVPGGLKGVTANNMSAVVGTFFEPGSDALAFQVPAGVTLHALQRRDQFNDSADLAGLDEFLECASGG